MAFFDLESHLFPDDNPHVPQPGSDEQKKMVALMEAVSDDDYERGLGDFLEVSFAEVMGDHLRATVETLHLSRQDPSCRLRVLDLGTGMGMAARHCVEHLGDVAELTIHDISHVLLDRAKANLGRHFPDLTIHTLQLDSLRDSVADALPRDSFDVVLASNFFEHIPRDRQGEIFGEVHQILRPGGVFSNVAHVKPLRADWKTDVLESMRKLWAESGRDAGMFKEAVEDHFINEHVHTSVPLLFRQLGDAGFRFYDCTYRRWIFGGTVAVK